MSTSIVQTKSEILPEITPIPLMQLATASGLLRHWQLQLTWTSVHAPLDFTHECARDRTMVQYRRTPR